jgi:hypothetical protein
MTMVDSGVTHNFLRQDMLRRLGLQPEPMQTTFKAVNLGVERVIGVAKDVSLKLGDWCELSLETEVECSREGKQPTCWGFAGLERRH